MTSEFYAMNPFHQIPTLEGSDGVVLGESNAILRYLAANYATQYYPGNPKMRARIDSAMEVMATSLFEKWAAVIYPLMGFAWHVKDPVKALNELKEEMDGFAHTFIGDSTFIAGDILTIADFKVLPFFYVLTLEVTHQKNGAKLSSRLEKYVNDVMAAIPSASIMASCNGFSLKEHIGNRTLLVKEFRLTMRVCGEAPACAPPSWDSAEPMERNAKLHCVRIITTRCFPAALFVKDADVGLPVTHLESTDSLIGLSTKNPLNSFPMYEALDGFIISGSGSILRYVAVNYASIYYPYEAKTRGRIDWAMDALVTSVSRKIETLTLTEWQSGYQTGAKDECVKILRQFEEAFLSSGRFVCGDVLTIADYQALPLFFALSQSQRASRRGFKLPIRYTKYIDDVLHAIMVESKTLLESTAEAAEADSCQ